MRTNRFVDLNYKQIFRQRLGQNKAWKALSVVEILATHLHTYFQIWHDHGNKYSIDKWFQKTSYHVLDKTIICYSKQTPWLLVHKNSKSYNTYDSFVTWPLTLARDLYIRFDDDDGDDDDGGGGGINHNIS